MTAPRTALFTVQALAAKHRVSRAGNVPNDYEPTWSAAEPWKEDHLEEVDHARAFIRAADRPRLRRPLSSYWWKHVAEKWHGEGSAIGRTYVSNGAFIIAAYLEGLKPRRIVHDRRRGLSINSTIRLP